MSVKTWIYASEREVLLANQRHYALAFDGFYALPSIYRSAACDELNTLDKSVTKAKQRKGNK